MTYYRGVKVTPQKEKKSQKASLESIEEYPTKNYRKSQNHR